MPSKFYVPGLVEQVNRLRLDDTNLVIRSDLLLGLVGALEEQEAELTRLRTEAHQMQEALESITRCALDGCSGCTNVARSVLRAAEAANREP